jgi:hypothetical protein
MGATLTTLRKYTRAEVHDPAPLEKMAASVITHDGGNNSTAFMQDASYDFKDENDIVIGDVVFNVTKGGSIATISGFLSSGGSKANDKLVVGSIEGGSAQDYDDADIVELYDRHAQKGLDGMRFTNTEVEDALAQAQKLVAIRFGGVEKYNVHQDIKVMAKIDLVTLSGTFTVGEQVTGGDNSHGATVEYIGGDFLVVSRMITRVPMDGVSGTFQVGETVQGSTNAYTGVVKGVNANYLDLYRAAGEFDDDETLTGATSGATSLVNSADYGASLFVLGETLTGATSAATANVKSTYANNNFYVGQDMPTDLKHLINARWWDGSSWNYLARQSMLEYEQLHKSSGDPLGFLVWGQDQLSTDSSPTKKIWLWPNVGVYQYNELHLSYHAWDRTLTGDTTATEFEYMYERLLVLEAAKILAGGDADKGLHERLIVDITLLVHDVQGTDQEVTHVTQKIDWDYGHGPGELY